MEIVSNDAILSMEKAQIDMQIATAKQYPRKVERVRNNLLTMATLDEDTASACFYTLPRGGKQIEGPSVRLAEMALAAYGNVKAGTRILSVHTGENPHAVVQAAVIDLENNVAYTVEKRRRITAKKGRDGVRKPVDDDDIQLAVNAGSAIAFRDAVLKVVPRALITPVLNECKRVAVGDVKSLAAKRAKVVQRLNQMGVTNDRIFAAVEVTRIDDIDAEKLATLIGAGQSIRDGATLEDVFPPAQSEPAPSKPVFPTPPATQTATPQPPAAQAAPTTTTPPESALAADPTTSQAEPKSPQEQLAELVTGAGSNFDDFKAWAVQAGFLKADNLATSFEEFSIVFVNKLLKNPAGLQAALRKS